MTTSDSDVSNVEMRVRGRVRREFERTPRKLKREPVDLSKYRCRSHERVLRNKLLLVSPQCKAMSRQWKPNGFFLSHGPGPTEKENQFRRAKGTDAANPDQKLYLVAETSMYAFQQHAYFYAGRDYFGEPWYTLQFVASGQDLQLVMEVADPKHNIYCFAFPMGFPVLFGKVRRRSQVYRACQKAFGKVLGEFRDSKKKR